ncbi:MAG: glycosyl transferase [Bacteroidetes bacterium]|nr:sugar transferase [Bacteroidia bacterium]PCH66152.1 MAG: glycosyl transferase [Bacteroidota bacterium]
MIKRLFDIAFALSILIILSPLLIIISLLIKLDSKGEILFSQIRVGKNNKDFKIFKFRTMFIDSEKEGYLSHGTHDKRITPIGKILRKFKLDELPQLFNVLIGDMSIVGPRPEVRKYVDFYSEEQMKVLTVKPGITEYASIEFTNENEILEQYDDIEKAYIETIMPQKLNLNLRYVRSQSILQDVRIIILTLKKLI